VSYKAFFYFLILAAVVFGQIAFASSANSVINNINLLVIALVFLINLADFGVIVFFAVSSGLIIDIYSNLPFGTFMLTMIATATLLEILFYNFFTNRSFYSLIVLSLIGTTIYNIMFLSISGIAYYFGWSDFFAGSDYFWRFVKQLIFNAALLSLLFYLFNLLSKKYKPIFLK